MTRMLDFGLVFDISFTDNELHQLLDWTLVDEKIRAGISSIEPALSLPQAPPNIQGTVNGTTWLLVKLWKETVKRSGGHQQIFFIPPVKPPTIATFSLDHLIAEFGVPNQLSRPNGNPPRQPLCFWLP